MPSELPERISLLQAALWLTKGKKPVSEERFRIAKVNLTPADTTPDGPLGELVVALHENDFKAYASLGTQRHGNGAIMPFMGSRMENIAPVEPSDWWFDNVVWNESALTYRGGPHKLPPELQSFSRQLDDVNLGPTYWFPINVSPGDLVAVFPRLVGHSEEELPGPKRGRPRKYDWDRFYVELAVKADLDGLPDAQAACEQWAQTWFEKIYTDSPAVSLIREKVAPIYSHPRKKAGK